MTIEPLPGLYVHVPFCGGKCPYCDFYSISATKLIPAWLTGLAGEIEMVRDQWPEPFDTLYFGGGTPSILPNETIAECFRLLQASFDFSRDTEITFEINPEDESPELFTLLKNLGVNRFSVGAQSFDQKELDLLGRRHSAESVKRCIDSIREVRAALSLDLIYGLPGQSLEKWRDTLEIALACAPEHLSCYALTPEPGTMFGRRVQNGEVVMPGEDVAAEFFRETGDFLEARGYIHYEISNFSRGENNRSRHNSKYWDHTPYLGLGPAAHSYRQGARWWNVRSVRKYAEIIAAGRPPEEDRELLTEDQVRLEKTYLGLRTRAGVSLDLLSPGSAVVAENLVADGLAEKNNGSLVLTRRGMCLADRLAEELSG